MNELFVNVKVDREERPDIDHIYMTALHAMDQQGGWPLTMFLDPDGQPMYGGTYWPPEPRWGRPSFRQILEGVASAWRTRRAEMEQNGAALFDHVARLSAPSPGRALTPDDLTKVGDGLLRAVDPVHGGIGGAPKFPNAPIFRFFWNEMFRRKDPRFGEAVRALVEAISAGGIYDHLGGGYARYSTDAEWLVPHFEKMLYDNAQILELLALVHALWPEPVFAARARETVGWLMREMRVADAFAASLDADQDGEEGLFYVWREEEIDAALGEASARFKAAYDVTRHGNWEGRTVLRRIAPQGSPDEEADLAASREKLFQLREKRARPGRDDKVLADWNGLTIAALARASAVFGEPDWLATARSTFDFVTSVLRGADGRLLHAWRDGRAGARGMLDDYASMARAALSLFEASGEPADLDAAQRLAAEALDLFGDGEGGVYLTASDAADVPGARPRHAHDGATPSGAGLLVEVFATTLASDQRGPLARGRGRPHSRLFRRARGNRRQPAPAHRRRHARTRRLDRRRRGARRPGGASARGRGASRPRPLADRAPPRSQPMAERACATTCRGRRRPSPCCARAKPAACRSRRRTRWRSLQDKDEFWPLFSPLAGMASRSALPSAPQEEKRRAAVASEFRIACVKQPDSLCQQKAALFFLLLTFMLMRVPAAEAMAVYFLAKRTTFLKGFQPEPLAKFIERGEFSLCSRGGAAGAQAGAGLSCVTRSI